jgi:hypothetical protein
MTRLVFKTERTYLKCTARAEASYSLLIKVRAVLNTARAEASFND